MLTEPTNVRPCAPNARPALSNDLARHYAARIRRHASRVARRLPRHVGIQDLMSAGYAGLVDAFVRYDTERMDSFEAYIDHRIRGAILDELRGHDPLTRDQRAFARRLTAATHRLTAALARTPDEAEVAAALGLAVDALRDQLSRMSATAARSSAGAFDDDELADPEGDDDERPDVRCELGERRRVLAAAMDRLPARPQLVLRLYYDEGQTLRQIAERLGVTESRVSQIHSEAVARLRAMVCHG